MNKNDVPENYSLGLAIYDIFPVLFFGVSVILLGISLKGPLFLLGGLLCLWAGIAKVIWKLIVVLKKRNVWWMFMQMRIFMPIGFLIMILGCFFFRDAKNAGNLWNFATSFPVSLFFIAGLAGFVAMGICGAVLDSKIARNNWIEQTINTIAQLLILLGVVMLFISVNFYEADETAKKALQSNEKVIVSVTEDEIVFSPKDGNTKTGLILYPGGAVEFTSYAPIMSKIAEEGITCILVRFPLNYAFLGTNKADDVIKEHAEIENWYLAGHSLGGAFGGIYASQCADKLSGMILLAAYTTKAISDLPVLSICGSNDGVIQRDKYEKYHSNLPDDVKEFVIEGGNHAYYGNYGEQKGDGTALISREEQQAIVVNAIVDFIQSH